MMKRIWQLWLINVLLIQACSHLPESQTAASPSSTSPKASERQTTITPNTAPSDNELSQGSFTRDTLYSLMVAEIAASRQQYDITLDNYISAAKNTQDIGIIARAARLAQYFRAQQSAIAMGELWLQQEPSNIEANAIVSSAYLNTKQPLQALHYAERILALIADDETSNSRAAITETIANYARDADDETLSTLIERYSQLIEQYPQYLAIKVGLSTLYQHRKEIDAAYETINQALAQDADYLPAILQEINLLRQNNQVELATQKLEAQLDKQPDNQRLRLLYARLLTQTDISAAYEQFTTISEQSPKQLDVKFSRALIALELQKKPTAQQLLSELLAVNYRPNTVNFYLGNLAEMDERFDIALGHYLAVKPSEDYIPAHSRAARIIAKRGQIDEARAHFDRLREQSPRQRLQLFAAEAEVLDSINEKSKAIEVLTQAIGEYPDDSDLRYERSSLYEQTDQLALMESDLLHILSQQPDNAAALNALGYFLTTRTDRHQEALTLISKALDLKPNDPAIIDSMGWVLFNLGEYEQAISYLRKAFELFPDPEIAAHLGEALWVSGNQQEAKSIWNNNLKENPNSDYILDTIERLQVDLE